MIDALLAKPIDPAPLALFRIFVALTILSTTIKRYGFLYDYFTSSKYYYHYELLPFLRPPRAWAVHGFLCLEIFGAAALLFGWGLPWTGYLLTASFARLFFSDKALFRHHSYLILLLSFLLASTNSAATLSVDSYLAGGAASTIPAWQVYIFRLQLLIVYTYAALSKAHWDWLVRFYPLRKWMREFKGRPNFTWSLSRYCASPSLARLLEKLFKKRWLAGLWSWAGFLTDLTVIPLMWYPPTRVIGITLFLCFHVLNHWFFRLGAFPYVNYAAIFLFLEPATCRSLIEYIQEWL